MKSKAPPIKLSFQEPKLTQRQPMKTNLVNNNRPKKTCSYLHSQQEHVRRIREEIEERKKILQSLDASFTDEKQTRWANVMPPERGLAIWPTLIYSLEFRENVTAIVYATTGPTSAEIGKVKDTNRLDRTHPEECPNAKTTAEKSARA